METVFQSSKESVWTEVRFSHTSGFLVLPAIVIPLSDRNANTRGSFAFDENDTIIPIATERAVS